MNLKTVVIIVDLALIVATVNWFGYRLIIGMDSIEFIFSWFYAAGLLISLMLNLAIISKK
jgi:hypothetical protein